MATHAPLSVEIRIRPPPDCEPQRQPAIDVKAMRKELHRMKMELLGALDDHKLGDAQSEGLLQRDGSVRGRSLHVLSTIRHLSNMSNWKKDYIAEESGQVVVYITSCGIVKDPYERCKDALSLLRALGIQHEVRDVYLEPRLMDELLDRMQLEPSQHRDLVFDSLPMVYVNGRYFGNDGTLIQENEEKSLVRTLREFHGRINCDACAGVGYIICRKCSGGKKTTSTFAVRLKCASCNANGIAPCGSCAPRH